MYPGDCNEGIYAATEQPPVHGLKKLFCIIFKFLKHL